MKKILCALVALTALALTSCDLGTGGKSFDPELLSAGNGRWKSTRTIAGSSHQIYQRFMSDGTGYEWDTTDGVAEEEALNFKWSLTGKALTYTHQDLVTGQYMIPERFTVLNLTAATLEMEDDVDGTVITATKVN